jgi:hypothetical protein
MFSWLDACLTASRSNFRRGESAVGGLDLRKDFILWLKF